MASVSVSHQPASAVQGMKQAAGHGPTWLPRRCMKREGAACWLMHLHERAPTLRARPVINSLPSSGAQETQTRAQEANESDEARPLTGAFLMSSAALVASAFAGGDLIPVTTRFCPVRLRPAAGPLSDRSYGICRPNLVSDCLAETGSKLMNRSSILAGGAVCERHGTRFGTRFAVLRTRVTCSHSAVTCVMNTRSSS